MAFDRANLQRVGPQNNNAPSLWTFVDASTTLANIDASGYMSAAADMLQVGDFIFAVGSNGYGVFVVVSNSRDLAASPPVAGVVDLSNAVALGAIDSD